MTLKIISGGQTGVDIGALRAAFHAGFETSGAMPHGFLTEDGNKPDRRNYGLYELPTVNYVTRTEHNVVTSQVTFWYGNPESRGGKLTCKLCSKHGKAFITVNNISSEDIADMILRIGYTIINIAGNRESISPGIEKKAYDLFYPAFLIIRDSKRH